MNRDPKYFPDYEEFRPERYLDESGQLNDLVPDTHHQGHLSFGCGRRCASPALPFELVQTSTLTPSML